MDGLEADLRKLDRLPDIRKLKDYPFYRRPGLSYSSRRDAGEVADHFEKAPKLTGNPFEERFF